MSDFSASTPNPRRGDGLPRPGWDAPVDKRKRQGQEHTLVLSCTDDCFCVPTLDQAGGPFPQEDEGWDKATVLNAWLVACQAAHLVITWAAIDRAIILGQEWNLGLGSALCADNGMHFARSTFRAVPCSTRRAAASRTAGRTATGLVHQTF